MNHAVRSGRSTTGVVQRSPWPAGATKTREYAQRGPYEDQPTIIADAVALTIPNTTPLIGVVRKLTATEADWFRKQKARRRRPEATHATERAEDIAIQLDPERAAYESEMRKVLAMIEERLSPVTSAAFTLRRQQGRSSRQIAEAWKQRRTR